MEDSVRLKVRSRTQGIAQGGELGLELFGGKFSRLGRLEREGRLLEATRLS